MSEKAQRVFESRGLNGSLDKIDIIKILAEDLWDEFDSLSDKSSPEAARLVALAKTDLEGAVMWAVKAVSRS